MPSQDFCRQVPGLGPGAGAGGRPAHLLRHHVAHTEDVAMRTFEFDFAPMWRSTIGFDRFFDLINESQHLEVDNYPPYDVLRTGDDSYRIKLAVAGFSPD